MALTKQTMTNEQRKSVAIEYLKAFDNGGVTSDGGSIMDLFAEDAQVYFPKWGIARGAEQIGKLFTDIGGTIKSIVHHYPNFNWIFSGEDFLSPRFLSPTTLRWRKSRKPLAPEFRTTEKSIRYMSSPRTASPVLAVRRKSLPS
jgi:hypothetical protein